MNLEYLFTRVASAIHQSPDQTEIMLDGFMYVFNNLHKNGYSYGMVCKMVMEAVEVENKKMDDPDIQFVANWLRSM
jgi:hypothetical protein